MMNRTTLFLIYILLLFSLVTSDEYTSTIQKTLNSVVVEVEDSNSNIDVEVITDLNEDFGTNINSNENNKDDMNKTEYNLRVKVGNKELSATLLNNVTTRAFIEKLPITLCMLDLYSREMCYRFSKALPTDDVNFCGYEVGEIVYYPPMHSFVILYSQNGESFSMQKMGYIYSGIDVFDNIGDVDISFELANE